ncbi:hypothetical protein AVV29_gp066 [Vibrio phage phi 3]|uniref:Uncharacterized protein n=1 Tax=Vibrio phage phi 3 TaxID=1589298 RepID=A0A0B5H344_9CAUD|nr:hypothetical protein AVV29_gp066 [Vibrio phage phi 3]AJF40912.1 hypothetical protein SBVP3_00145 [Vibrio phage phi 3]
MTLYIGRKNSGEPLLHLTNTARTEAEMKTGNTFSDTLFHSDMPFLTVIDIITITEFNDAGVYPGWSPYRAGTPKVTDPATVAKLDYYFNNGYLFDARAISIAPAGVDVQGLGTFGSSTSYNRLFSSPVLNGEYKNIRVSAGISNRSAASGTPPSFDNSISAIQIASSSSNLVTLSGGLARVGDLNLRFANTSNYISNSGSASGSPSLVTNWRNITTRMLYTTGASAVGPFSYPNNGSNTALRFKVQIYIFNLKKTSNGNGYEFGRAYGNNAAIRISGQEITVGDKSIKDLSFAYTSGSYSTSTGGGRRYDEAGVLGQSLLLEHYNRSCHDWWYNIYPAANMNLRITPGGNITTTAYIEITHMALRATYKYPTLKVGDPISFEVTANEIKMRDESNNSISIAKVGSGRRLKKSYPQFKVTLPGQTNLTPPTMRAGASVYTQPTSSVVIVGLTTYTKTEVISETPIPDEFFNRGKTCHISGGLINGTLSMSSYGMNKTIGLSNIRVTTSQINADTSLPVGQLASYNFYIEQNMSYYDFYYIQATYSNGNKGSVQINYNAEVIGNTYRITRVTRSTLSSSHIRGSVITDFNTTRYYDEVQSGVADNQLVINYPEVTFNLLLLGVEDK